MFLKVQAKKISVSSLSLFHCAWNQGCQEGPGCLRTDEAFFNRLATANGCVSCDVKGSGQYSDGKNPAVLYQDGSYGSALHCLRSKLACPMEGSYTSKATPCLKDVKYDGVGHVNHSQPEDYAVRGLLTMTKQRSPRTLVKDQHLLLMLCMQEWDHCAGERTAD